MYRILIIAVIAIFSFTYGALVGRHEIFPFNQILYLKRAAVGGYNEVAALNPREEQFRIFTPQVDVVLIGDSLTERGIWNDIFPAIRLSNRGLGGDTTGGVFRRLSSIRALNPDMALIMIGVNDVRSDFSTDEIMSNYEAIVRALRSDGTNVIIQSTIECARQRCGDALDEVRDLNIALRQYALENSLEFVDLNDHMAHAEAGLLPHLSKDGVHLSAEGYAVWARQIEPFLTR